MVKGFSPTDTLVTFLFAAIASCFPAPLGRNNGDSDSGTVATGMMAGSSSHSTASSNLVVAAAVPYTSNDPHGADWASDSNIEPEPERGTLGASIIGPQNVPLELQNDDLLTPPTTDNGDM